MYFKGFLCLKSLRWFFWSLKRCFSILPKMFHQFFSFCFSKEIDECLPWHARTKSHDSPAPQNIQYFRITLKKIFCVIRWLQCYADVRMGNIVCVRTIKGEGPLPWPWHWQWPWPMTNGPGHDHDHDNILPLRLENIACVSTIKGEHGSDPENSF